MEIFKNCLDTVLFIVFQDDLVWVRKLDQMTVVRSFQPDPSCDSVNMIYSPSAVNTAKALTETFSSLHCVLFEISAHFRYCFELLCMIFSREFSVLNQQQCAKTPLVMYDNSSNWSCRFIADKNPTPVNKKTNKTEKRTPGSLTAGPAGGMVVKLCVCECIHRYVMEEKKPGSDKLN